MTQRTTAGRNPGNVQDQGIVGLSGSPVALADRRSIAIENEAEMSKRRKTDQTLIQELSLALEVASKLNSTGTHWGTKSPFQDQINALLVRSGRKPVTADPADERTREA